MGAETVRFPGWDVTRDLGIYLLLSYILVVFRINRVPQLGSRLKRDDFCHTNALSRLTGAT